ncbi:MAG: hypothetical protein LRY55_02565 [Leadbetterella sp.]|nr:hypothetical protein [Leadbetterella sp.]
MKRHIFRVLGLLMLFCVFTTQVSAWTVRDIPVISSEQDTDDDRPVFKQLTHETVVPHYDFSFGEISGFFRENFTVFFPEVRTVAASCFSSPVNTYMAKLLEHHIAINAP